MGIWPGIDVGPGTLRGKILPPYSILPMAGLGSGVWFHAPAVGSERKNTGGQFLFGDESRIDRRIWGGPLTGGRVDSGVW